MSDDPRGRSGRGRGQPPPAPVPAGKMTENDPQRASAGREGP